MWYSLVGHLNLLVCLGLVYLFAPEYCQVELGWQSSRGESVIFQLLFKRSSNNLRSLWERRHFLQFFRKARPG